MEDRDLRQLTEVLLETTSTLVGIAVRALGAGPLDTTVVQQRVLNLLAQHGSLTINEIAAELGVDQSNASRHCTRLEAMGAVTRTRSAHDLRSVAVSLSETGERHVAASREARRALVHQAVLALGTVPPPTVVDTLARFNAAAASVRVPEERRPERPPRAVT